ncbi:MAG: NAD-dependent epimerase [Pseudomonadota bacterium]
MDNKVLITGAAGFIGYHLSRRLLDAGRAVVGIDNLNDYYDPHLKRDRLKQLEASERFTFIKMDLADRTATAALFKAHDFTAVVNLAAQAGVRYSLENPAAYIDANIVGFANLLEGARQHKSLRHLVFASSSSVYGANTKTPFSVHHNVDHPVSLYAATKKSNELMAHAYSQLFGLPCTGLRFFTVYGPWGRPDMAYFSFTRDILAGRPIKVFNHGRMQRDFTYIDDIVEGIVKVIDTVPAPNPDWSGDAPDPGTSYAPYRIYNIGNNQPVALIDFIETLERALGIEAQKVFMDMQPGDVKATHADIDDLIAATGFCPHTQLEEGIRQFVAWYRGYYSE